MTEQTALPERLAAALAQKPPLVQHFQTAPDCWELSWRQSPRRLRYLFSQTSGDAPQRHCCNQSTGETNKVIHFRQKIDVECGTVHILLESDHCPNAGFVLTALVGFSPRDHDSPLQEVIPAMRIAADWGSFTHRLVIDDGRAIFPLITCQQLGCTDTNTLPPLTVTLATA